jgi:triosephosphate isomerase (TIM)
MSMPVPILVANWKMHKTLEEGLAWVRAFIEQLEDTSIQDVSIILCPAFIHLAAINRLIANSPSKGLHLGAQNCHHEEAGAFTGEISAAMVHSVGAHYVLVGHSERRQYLGEDNSLLAAKVSRVLMQQGMRPIFCCGEDLATREKGLHISWVSQQLADSLWHLTELQIGQVIIAYEPVWAIGTGQIPSLPEIEEMHQAIKESLAQRYGNTVAAGIPILYGGSCNAQNAALLLSNPTIDGLLVGGATLQVSTFLPIVRAMYGEPLRNKL